MFALLSGEAETPRPTILPEAALERLREHQVQYARWLLGPDPFRVGQIVTIRRDAPIGGHGDMFMVVEVDRHLSRDGMTTPPPRSRRTGIREDVRVAFISRDVDSTVRAMWVEGWMLESWSLEQAERHRKLMMATGREQ